MRSMMPIVPLLILCLVLLLPSCCRGSSLHVEENGLKLPTFVASHMVLQREPLQARLWGWTSRIGANVTVQLDHGVILAFGMARKDGSWTIHLPPQPAGVGHTLVVSDGAFNRTLEDIAFGDVYLCSGQSNMEMAVGAAFNATEEIADSVHYPHLRLATVALVVADTPQPDAPSKTGDYVWTRSGPDAFDLGNSFSWYSATCYFFGRDLYKSLGGTVPIGLVTSCWGGQTVECFSSPDALADDTCGGTQEAPDLQQQVDDAYLGNSIDEGEFGVNPQPTQLWNAMIHPLISMRFTGVIWYQGEANAANPTSYACRFPAMIADWRLKFHLPNLGFYYVQLAAFPDSDYTLIRSAQDAALALPKVGAAIAIDLGDPSSPAGAIHPRRKQEVGRRLSLVVRAMEFQEANVDWHGPTLWKVDAADPKAVTLEFRSSTPLQLKGTAACDECCNDASPFEVLSDLTKGWTPAVASSIVANNKIVITHYDDIIGVRLNWQAYPQCALYNGAPFDDLVTAPFEWCKYPTIRPKWTGKACGIFAPSTTVSWMEQKYA